MLGIPHKQVLYCTNFVLYKFKLIDSFFSTLSNETKNVLRNDLLPRCGFQTFTKGQWKICYILNLPTKHVLAQMLISWT